MPNQGGTEQHVKSGHQSHKYDDDKRQQQAQGGNDRNQGEGHRGGGGGNFAEDRERASEAGRKGGRH